jgi:hypothetical protein
MDIVVMDLTLISKPVLDQDCSFLKKRTKRLFILRQRTDPGHGRRGATSADVKVFWFFSSEKNILP